MHPPDDTTEGESEGAGWRGRERERDRGGITDSLVHFSLYNNIIAGAMHKVKIKGGVLV